MCMNMKRSAVDSRPLSCSGQDHLKSLSSSSSADSNNTTNTWQHRAQTLRRSPSAAFLHSAVRSVLDDASPSTIVSDDKSDQETCLDGDMATPTKLNSPSLTSLRTEKVPPIPEEQDRRRFIGCLAAVLASSYEYEGNNDALDVSGSFFEYEDDVDCESLSEETHGAREVLPPYPTLPDCVSAMDKAKTCVVEEPPSETVHTGETARRKSNNSSNKQQQNTFIRQDQPGVDRWKNRNRRRRYDVLCEFLSTSAELLLLDRSVARAFVPMLSCMLAPKPKPGKTANNHQLYFRPRAKSHSLPISQEEKAQFLATSASFSTGDSNISSQCTTIDYNSLHLGDENILRPFLESMSPGSGFRCLSLLLLQHLLSSEVGYDARVRHALKRLGVIVLAHEMRNDPLEFDFLPVSSANREKDIGKLYTHATRKFEALEQKIAGRLIRLSESKCNLSSIAKRDQNPNTGVSREMILRGVKIGSAGIVAGTLFAFTGGLAASGIAAGVAAVTGSAAATTAAVVALTSPAVVTTIFGVGGGSLAAYKMQRRTQGLTEFQFIRETKDRTRGETTVGKKGSKLDTDSELFSVICISGWLRDKFDFQRPWGLHPTQPRLTDRLELLERFYSVYRPDHVQNCERILASWKCEEHELWRLLREKYGRDPDTLFPLKGGARENAGLTLEQEETLDLIFAEMGYISMAPAEQTAQRNQPTPFERMKEAWNNQHHAWGAAEESATLYSYKNGLNRPYADRANVPNDSLSQIQREASEKEEEEYRSPKHLATVWDFGATYGGELYTVRWESELLKTICDCVMDLAMDVVSGATRQILKQTILSTFLAAIVWPSYLLNVANMIDGDWTLAVERADQAGKEMARTLLLSRTGQRPATLVGFSFGARVVYSCLKELARLQGAWENYQAMKHDDRKRSAAEHHQFTKLEKEFSGMREPASIVEDAVIMGLPNHLSLQSWKACRQVVAGRLINCYSTKDLILSLMFQAKRFSPGVQTILKPVCGTCEVEEAGVENFNVSDLVQGHQDYCLLTGQILERVKFGEPLLQTSMFQETQFRKRLDFSGTG